jgi:hypothetical protein
VAEGDGGGVGRDMAVNDVAAAAVVVSVSLSLRACVPARPCGEKERREENNSSDQ